MDLDGLAVLGVSATGGLRLGLSFAIGLLLESNLFLVTGSDADVGAGVGVGVGAGADIDIDVDANFDAEGG